MGEMNPQVTYKPVHKNPMDKNRSPTDTLYLYLFVLLLAAWFIMNCIFLFRTSNMETVPQDELAALSSLAIVELPKLFGSSGVGIIIWIALSGTIIFLLFLKTLNCLAKFWTIVGVIILILSIIGLVIHIFTAFYATVSAARVPPAMVSSLMFGIIKAVVQIIYLVVGIHATLTVVKLHGVAEIIRKTSHAIFFFPTVFLFGLVLLILSLTVIAFTATSVANTASMVPALFSLLGGLYLLAFIFNFGCIVISQCISSWYWSQNKEELSSCILLKSIGLVGRNHIGSVAFCSTGILPIILSVYVLCKNKFPPPPNSGFRAFLVKWALIAYASDYALVLTASHGHGIHEATKKIYSLFTRSCALVLSFCSVVAAVFATFLGIAMLISMGVAYAMFQNIKPALTDSDFMQSASMYYGLGIYLFIAAFVTAVVAASTILVNTAEEIEENEEREMNHILGNA